MFSIVSFVEEGNVAAVPNNWLEGSGCRWPNFPTWSKKFKNAVRGKDSPKTDWALYPVKILRSFGKNVFVVNS
jgi:hypothetical protein